MRLPLGFHSDAQKEFDAVIAWYESQRPGLGEEFISRVEDALDRIGRTPEGHALVRRDVRCARVHRFPYAIYYRVEADRVTVVSVFHASRDPHVWQSRVT